MRSLLVVVLTFTTGAASAQIAAPGSAGDVDDPAFEYGPCGEAVPDHRSSRQVALAWTPGFLPELTATPVQSRCDRSSSVAVLPEGVRFDLRPMPPGPEESLGRTVLREQELDWRRQLLHLSTLRPAPAVADESLPLPFDLPGRHP